jgi:hypothetical protein
MQSDSTLGTSGTDQASVIGQINMPIYDGGTVASQTPAGEGAGVAEKSTDCREQTIASDCFRVRAITAFGRRW